jgi:hypothetical protein
MMMGKGTVGEGVVEAILWYEAGPHSEPPASIAAMEPHERERLWATAEGMVNAHGHDYAMGVAEYLAQHHVAQDQDDMP